VFLPQTVSDRTAPLAMNLRDTECHFRLSYCTAFTRSPVIANKSRDACACEMARFFYHSTEAVLS